MEKSNEWPRPEEEVKSMSIEESPQRPTVTKSTEKGFDLGTCFEKVVDEYQADSDYYFNSYSHFGIHEDMLKDKVDSHIRVL
jgi:hypothetical protein